MTINEHIPTEIIQTFSSSEVFKYHIIPYEKEGADNLKCYGKEGVDYASLINEVEVIYGISVTLTLLNETEFDRGLNLYYRKGKTSQSNINISQINDRGFWGSVI